jgi:hypothetical protein
MPVPLQAVAPVAASVAAPAAAQVVTQAPITVTAATTPDAHDVVIKTINEQFVQETAAQESAAQAVIASDITAATTPINTLVVTPLDRDALHSVVSAVGLTWVESNSESVVTAHAAVHTAPSAPRYGREPKAAPAAANVELKQVETQSS